MSEQPTAKKIFLCFQPTDSTNQLTFAIKIFPGTQRDEIEKAIINRIGGKPEDRIIVVDNDDCDLVINENIPANTTENPYRVRLVANNGINKPFEFMYNSYKEFGHLLYTKYLVIIKATYNTVLYVSQTNIMVNSICLFKCYTLFFN